MADNSGSYGNGWECLKILACLGLVWLVSGGGVVLGQVQTSTNHSIPDEGEGETADPPLTYLESVTVSATMNPSPLRETPGLVSIIDENTIQDQLMQNFADLVKYEPGVYIENDVTRLGLNGFNIRGVGGNRVMTQVDGVETSEQFDFGPFNVHQASLDPDTLKSVEIVRSANSALYGSDALGGVVSLFTKDPADYLGGNAFHIGAKTTWDGRADDLSGNLVLAGGNSLVQGSLFASASSGHEFQNKGTDEATDSSRTVPNPQDRDVLQLLAKVAFNPSPGNQLRVAAELFDATTSTQVFSQFGSRQYGPMRIDTNGADALDTSTRWRVSLDQSLIESAGLDLLSWRVYGQSNGISQVVDERRTTFGYGPPTPALRKGTLDFDQSGTGGMLQAQKWIGASSRATLITFGANFRSNSFDVLRDRVDRHAVTGDLVPTRLVFPTKYFPDSAVKETGAYVQAEFRAGRLTVVPGIRYDRFSLDADQADRVYLASLNPEPSDLSADAVSPKVGAAFGLTDILTLHAQYSGGFRAPPYSDINSGFTNIQNGYTALPNPALGPERSDNIEGGLRAAFARSSVSVTAFSNYYDNFIELATVGFNRATGLLEFQSQNLQKVEITGVEMRAEAFVGDAFRLRGSYAAIKGTDVSGESGNPLGSVAPNEGVLGLQYLHPSALWTAELSVRLVASRSAVATGQDQYVPDAYQVIDLMSTIALPGTMNLRLGILNLADTTYFQWWNVRGRTSDDPVIARYSSPGRSVIGSLGYDW